MPQSICDTDNVFIVAPFSKARDGPWHPLLGLLLKSALECRLSGQYEGGFKPLSNDRIKLFKDFSSTSCKKK